MTETLSTSKEIPKTRLALEEKYKNEPKEPHAKRLHPDNIKEVVNQLPEPVGYRLLVLPFKMKEKTKGGIIMSDVTIERQQVASQCGLVVALGDQCYDKERYPEGPWCKKGDWVVFARYAGSRIQIDGGEVRLLNDDEILATIENPEDIFHQY